MVERADWALAAGAVTTKAAQRTGIKTVAMQRLFGLRSILNPFENANEVGIVAKS